MKKFLGIFTLVIIISLVAIGSVLVSSGAPAPAYEISGQTVERGSSFSVVVSLENNPGIISLRFEVGYDETLLRLDSVEDLGLLEGYTPPAPTVSSPYTLRWSNSLWTDTSAPGSKASGELVKLNFTSISSEEATTEITISHLEANNSSGKVISFANSKANIEIKNKYTVKFLSEDSNEVISEQKYFLGESVVLPEDPVRESDGVNKYTFEGWDPEVVTTVAGDASYTAIFTAELLETDATLKSLSADGLALNPLFDPNVTEYSATVDFTVSRLALVLEANGALATYTVEGGELEVGENTVKIIVTAENGDVKTYTLTVTREKNPHYVEDDDSTLKEMTPSCGILSPSFSKDRTSYILYVSSSTSEVSFACVANSEKAKELSSDEAHLIDGDRTVVKLFCVAENGDKTEYTVTVVRLPEFDGEIPSFVFGDTDDPADKDGKGEDIDGEGQDKTSKLPQTTVIIIIAAASLCALASVVGIIFLLVNNRKNKKERKK